ncbi:hypothetical protein NHH03_07395 [Stieleria sp. TO1_6]|uniref:hypothetical protein n=1 Tax=Stieleria tagensis TaxID=2956795 RepID=UPI00209B83B8|nr:hypothetical protein [Stieleria tagensis]MCO8121555.1 hypothetical protein [Stieleria tagensis]
MDSDKIKTFIVYNFEKLIVGLVVLLAGFLVYSGLGKPVITEKRDPQNLATTATEVRRQVDEDHSEEIISERTTFDIAQKQKEFRHKVNPEPYTPDVWDVAIVSSDEERRQDPDLLKPVGLQVQGVLASLAYRSTDGVYALTELEGADPVEVVEQKPKRESRRRNNRAAMMMMEEQGGGDYEMEMQMQMEMDMQSYGDNANSASGPVRKLAADKNLGTKAAPTHSVANGAEELPIPGAGWFIAGSAAIPHKELVASYQKALSYATAYDPRLRDFPEYIAYEVQRADVTSKAIDQLTEKDWIRRDTNLFRIDGAARYSTLVNAARYWSGFAPEVVPPDYWIPGVTMWIPPVLLDPYTDIATNPLIPLKTQRELQQEQQLKEAAQNKESEVFDPTKFELDRGGSQSRSYGGGMEMEMDMMYDGGMEMEMDTMYGGGGGGPKMVGKPAEENPVDHKLLRFYDFAFIPVAKSQDPEAPKRNRKYVYRVRFAVNDPNFPEKPELQPKGSALAPEAYTRYVSLAADAAQNKVRDFRRWSEWSEVSQPVSLPELDRVFVGDVKSEKARRTRIGSRELVIESEPPVAEVVTSSFDPSLGVFVPAMMQATEGTVLSKKVEVAEVVDPITLEVKKLENAKIDSSATVVDIEGGLPMAITDDETITEPGMFLIMNSDGSLSVHGSVDEQRQFRIKSFAEERGL